MDPNRSMAVTYGDKDLKTFLKKERKKNGFKQKASFSALTSQGQHEMRMGQPRNGLQALNKVVLGEC